MNRGADTRRLRLAALAAACAAWPAVEFAWCDPGSRARRGMRDGARILTWTGGPAVEEVQAALAAARCLPWRDTLRRRMTEAEAAAWQTEQDARWEREAAERAATEPARRAAAKAEALAKRQATIAARKARKAALAARWPNVCFAHGRTRWGAPSIQWTDGPTEAEVRAALPRRDCPVLDRWESPAERARIAAEAERLECIAEAEAVAAAACAAIERQAARCRRLAALRCCARQLELIPCPGDCRSDPGPLPPLFPSHPDYAGEFDDE